MKNLFFIPVRKNSKGIPGKNLKKLGGKPLLFWILDAILNSGIKGAIWVATDWDDIERAINIHYKDKVKVFRRSSETSQDTSPTIDVVLEFLKQIPLEEDIMFILLQATSPFTTSEDIKSLAEKMEEKKYDSYISCMRLQRFRWSPDGIPLDYQLDSKPRRQEYNGFLIETGSFYASTVSQILITQKLISGKVLPVETGRQGFFDLDEPEDWDIAEALTHLYKPQ